MPFRRRRWRDYSDGEKRFIKIAFGGMLAVFVIGAPISYFVEQHRRQETHDRVLASCIADMRRSGPIGNETEAQLCERVASRAANPPAVRQKTDREQIQEAADRLERYCASTNDC